MEELLLLFIIYLFNYLVELWKTQFQSNLGSLPRQAKGWLENDSLSCGGGWQASSAVSRPVGSRLAPSPTGVSPFPRHLIHILTNEPYVVRRYLPHFLHEKLNESGHKLFSAVKMVVPHIDVSVSLTNARRAGKLRDSSKMLRIFFVRCLFRKLSQSPMGG